jgi:3-oxoacyl-[acyl-carrier protein] reductase
MDLGIKNRTALVTAAGRGLGRAVAERLSREGARVAICSRNPEEIEKTGVAIAGATGGQVLAAACDVTDAAQVSNFVTRINAELGPVEILVTNAGGPPAGLAADFTPDHYRDAVELNLMSTISLIYEVLPTMKERGWGRIVAITSVAAKQPIGNLILSNTARAGVLGFIKTISAQVASQGITVNSVLPGYTRTERVEELAEAYARANETGTDRFYEMVESDIPAGRMGKPEEFANAVAFLSSEAASYITGVSLPIDGGFTRGLF